MNEPYWSILILHLLLLMHGILSLRRTFHKYYTDRRIEATYQSQASSYLAQISLAEIPVYLFRRREALAIYYYF